MRLNRDEFVQPGAWGQPGPSAYEFMAGSDHMNQTGYAQGFDDAYAPNDSAWGYFKPTNVLAARSQGMSSCWNPTCDRVRTGAYWHSLSSNCHTSETGSRCANWARG